MHWKWSKQCPRLCYIWGDVRGEGEVLTGSLSGKRSGWAGAWLMRLSLSILDKETAFGDGAQSPLRKLATAAALPLRRRDAQLIRPDVTKPGAGGRSRVSSSAEWDAAARRLVCRIPRLGRPTSMMAQAQLAKALGMHRS